MQKNIEHIQSISTAFLEKLTVDYKLNGSKTNKLAGINSISIPKVSGESLFHFLDLKGFCVSTGSACDSVNTQISHVLKAIHLPDDLTQGTIRVSFGKDNTEDEAIMLAQAINKIVSLTK
jgi:cysteine desulfurase